MNKPFLKDPATEQVVATLGALPMVKRRWQRSLLAIFGVKALSVLMATLIVLPSPRLQACACAEVVGGAGAVNSSLSVDDSNGGLTLTQQDISQSGFIPVTLTRTYQSRSGNNGPFGPGWSIDALNYMVTTSNGWNGGDIQISFNGSLETFTQQNGSYITSGGDMSLTFNSADEVNVLWKGDKSNWAFNFADGTLKRYTDRNGNQIQYTWKVLEKTSEELGGTGTDTVKIYCPLTIAYPDGRGLQFTYGSAPANEMLCQKVEGSGGVVLSYGYTDGLLTSVQMGSGETNVLHYTYNKITYQNKLYAQLSSISYTNGAEIGISHQAGSGNNPTLSTVQAVTGPYAYNHSYQYISGDGKAEPAIAKKTDSLGHILSRENYPAAEDHTKKTIHRDALGHFTTTVSASSGVVLSRTDALGNTTTFDYDVNNPDPLAQTNRISMTNSLGKKWNYQYDSNQNQTKVADPLGHETNYTYDANNNLLTVQNGLNQIVISNTYTPHGQLATTKDGRNNTTSYTYNTSGFLIKETDAAGKDWNRTYDAAGNLLTVSDPLGNVVAMTYTALNRPLSVTDPLGKATNFAYDEMANLTSVTDANGGVTSATWDLFQRATSITDALNNTTTFAYDAEKNMTALTDALGHVQCYAYDAVNNQKTFKFPDNREESYEYDANNNLTKRIDCAGQQIVYAYNAVNRLISKTYGDGTVFSCSYDDANRLIGVTRAKNGNTESSCSFTLDAANRITAVTQNGWTIGYGYDLGQNVNQITYPSGVVAKYDYDTRDTMSIIKDAAGGSIAAYTKDDAGRVTTQTLGNGLVGHYIYDVNNRVTGIALLNGTNTVQSFAYGYDNIGSRIWVQYKDGTGDVYKYDATYQIIGVKYGVQNPQAGYDAAQNAQRTVSYTYDAVGNRVGITDNGNSSTYTVNNLNQYTAISGTNYTYNDAGELIGDGTWIYGYDPEGHLVSASKPGLNVTYKYDTQGCRIQKDINGTPTARYIYSGQSLIEERDGTGNTIIATYVYADGIDRPVKVIKSGNAYYFQQDALGNVTALTDGNGALFEQYTYDVYGAPTIKNGAGVVQTTAMTPFLFTGREYDSETGLYHYRARAYSPTLGRFLQRDPLVGTEISGGSNLYAYIENNPVNGIDPSGLKALLKCTRCRASGVMRCKMIENGKTSDPFTTNTGSNEDTINPGTYNLVPKPSSQMNEGNENLTAPDDWNGGQMTGSGGTEYPVGTPSVTGNGRQAGSPYQGANNIRVHGDGRSTGCTATNKANEIRKMMDRNPGQTKEQITDVGCMCENGKQVPSTDP